VIEALRRTGGLNPRQPKPSTALTDAREAVSRLVLRWDDRLAESTAADNLYLDRSKESRRHELEELRARVGACHPDGPFDAENALRGEWTMRCERGRLRVSVTLAPTMPPRVQYLQVRALEPGEAVGASLTCESR